MKGVNEVSLKILGGCREQGRSSFLLARGGDAWLLDCGVKRVVDGARVGEYPLIEDSELARIRAVVLSHGHEDHAAALPLLYLRGFRGEVWCTEPTARLAAEYCRSWLTAVRRLGAPEPYAEADIDRIRFATCSYGETVDIGVELRLLPAGHLLGASISEIGVGGRRLFYTGDVAYESRVLPEPSSPGDFDALIVDGSSGAERLGRDDSEQALFDLVRRAAERGGSTLLPLPRYGRSQELVVALYERRRELPPIYVEKGLREACEVYLEYRDWLRPNGAELLAEALASRAFHFIEAPEERADAVHDAPALFLAPDAMLSSGASLDYLGLLAADERNLVVVTGHVARGTTAARLLHGERRVSGPEGSFELRLAVSSAPLKIHPDREECLALAPGPGRRVIVVHSSPAAADSLAALFRSRGCDARAPAPGSEIELF